ILGWSAAIAAAQPKKKDDLDAWVKQVKGLPAEERLQATLAKLAERNPGFTAKEVHPTVEGGDVTVFHTNSLYLEDLVPFRALPELRTIFANTDRKGKVKDLTPLREMKRLAVLNLGAQTGVTDLAPLKGLPLRELSLRNTRVKDLAPLKGMRLEALDVLGTDV